MKSFLSGITTLLLPVPKDVCDREFLLMNVIMSSFFGDASRSQQQPKNFFCMVTNLLLPFPSDVCDREFLLVDVIMSSFLGDAPRSQP